MTMSCFHLEPNVRLIDLYDGAVYSLKDQMIETGQNGEFELVHVPIKDYPIMYTFGDFAVFKPGGQCE